MTTPPPTQKMKRTAVRGANPWASYHRHRPADREADEVGDGGASGSSSSDDGGSTSSSSSSASDTSASSALASTLSASSVDSLLELLEDEDYGPRPPPTADTFGISPDLCDLDFDALMFEELLPRNFAAGSTFEQFAKDVRGLSARRYEESIKALFEATVDTIVHREVFLGNGKNSWAVKPITFKIRLAAASLRKWVSLAARRRRLSQIPEGDTRLVATVCTGTTGQEQSPATKSPA